MSADNVVHCRSVGEVQALVRSSQKPYRPLYPYSTGLNWGYGGSQPPQPGALAVDLSQMNRILNQDEISCDNPVAVIEPGVTQGQLADFLAEKHPGLTFNVTGSARGTSLIGNCLDRGVGYLGPRREDLFGLEVVTGRGDLIQTGFRRLPGPTHQPEGPSPLAHAHPYGLGPMLDGLFFQGNFGIVTSACFKLLPKPPVQVAISMALLDIERLDAFVDALAALKREGVMAGVTHLANRARTHATLSYGMNGYLQRHARFSGPTLAKELEHAMALVAPSEWSSLGGVAGTAGQVRAALREVRQRLRGLARIQVVDETKLSLGFKVLHPLRQFAFARARAAAIDAIRPLHGLALGRPTDVAIENLLWKFGAEHMQAVELSASRCGVLFVSPALPMRGAFVKGFVAQMSAQAQRFGHQLYVTLNFETPTALVAVTNLLFDKSDPAQVDTAHACAAALQALVKAQGLSVYRARADMMPDVVDATSPYWRLVRDLKLALDPENVIAPGRYNLP